MIRVLLLIAGFILYGSLYPWQYRPGPPGVSPVQVLLHSWPAHFGSSELGDIAVNIVLYIPIGMFGFLALDRFRRRWLRWILPTLIAACLSTSIELTQVYDQTRACSLADVLCNTLGGASGTVLGYVFRRSMSEALFLVLHWLGSQFLLFLGVLAGRRAVPHWFASPVEGITFVSAWFLVLYLLTAPPEPKPRDYLTGGLAACFLTLLALRGLSPFHFQSNPSPFHWVPFIGVLNTEWIVGFPAFLEKAFYYGTATWLLRRAAVPLIYSAALVSCLLAFIEAMQRYLPNHTPEITDPILALALGFVLWLLEEDQKRIRRFGILQVST